MHSHTTTVNISQYTVIHLNRKYLTIFKHTQTQDIFHNTQVYTNTENISQYTFIHNHNYHFTIYSQKESR